MNLLTEKYREIKIDPDQFKTFLDALRSGKFKQGTARLDGPQGMCCLGVGCKVLIPEDKIEYVGKADERYISGFYGADQEHAPEWLKHLQKDVVNVAALNDAMTMKFSEIADILEDIYVNKLTGIQLKIKYPKIYPYAVKEI